MKTQTVPPKEDVNIRKLLLNSAVAAFSASAAELATIPFDTIKVRLQMQSTSGQIGAPKYSGLLGTAKTVSSEEGIAALYKGLTAGIHRLLIFSGLRVALYTPVLDAFSGPLQPGEHPRLLTKMLAASITGAI